MTLNSSDASANRKRRVAILKKRRAEGKVKPVTSGKRKQKSAEVAKLKAEKLAMKNQMQKEKKKMGDDIKAAKKKIKDEQRRNAKLEKELKSRKAREKKAEKQQIKSKVCNDAELGVLHKKMLSAVPTVREMQTFTSKDHSLHREVMSSVWTELRKYLVLCHKKRFESVKKAKKATKAKTRSGSTNPVFRNRPVFLPDIGTDVDEAAYKKATAAIFGKQRTSPPKPGKKKKKRKRIAPTLIG